MRKDASILTLGVLSGAGLLAGLYLIFFWVPTEEFSGVVQRLFYVHVPSAWVAYLAFTIVLVGSVAYLAGRNESWDLLARASAEVGVVFTGITLVTGMMWGRPVWGTFWQWEPRLTMTLVLFLIYLGYLTFRATATDSEGVRQVASVIGIAGFITVPLVHFSVTWWRGLHPSGVVNPAAGNHLPASMLATMLFMVGVFTILYTLFLVLRVGIGKVERQIVKLEAGI